MRMNHTISQNIRIKYSSYIMPNIKKLSIYYYSLFTVNAGFRLPPYLLLRREVSKEHRKDPIVQMELFMDTNGLPISYGLFSGNTLDKQTLIPMMGKLKEGFRIKSRLAPKKSVGIRGQKVFCPLMPTDCSAFHAPAILLSPTQKDLPHWKQSPFYTSKRIVSDSALTSLLLYRCGPHK